MYENRGTKILDFGWNFFFLLFNLGRRKKKVICETIFKNHTNLDFSRWKDVKHMSACSPSHTPGEATKATLAQQKKLLVHCFCSHSDFCYNCLTTPPLLDASQTIRRRDTGNREGAGGGCPVCQIVGQRCTSASGGQN